MTLMADLDDEAQALMSEWYRALQAAGFKGTQTHDIPYHISLAAFALEKEAEAVTEMERLAAIFPPVPVHISHIGIFAGGKVLFCAPDMDPSGLLTLHKAIQMESIDPFPWTPHATILMDEPETIQSALPVFVRSFRPFLCHVTALHLCAFWPTREIKTVRLRGPSAAV